jgi:hypothetical protein
VSVSDLLVGPWGSRFTTPSETVASAPCIASPVDAEERETSDLVLYMVRGPRMGRAVLSAVVMATVRGMTRRELVRVRARRGRGEFLGRNNVREAMAGRC